MFIGHFAVAFAAKRAAPTTSLGTLFLASSLIDILWPLLLLAGVETVVIAPGVTRVTPLDFQHYPWTHSLLMVAVWAAAFGALHYAARRRWLPAAVLALVVLSHWFLDLVVHRPDLPLAPGSDLKVGFGLWQSPAATLIVEGALFVLAVRFYLAGSQARDRIGHWALYGLLVLLLASYVASVFGPPPPGVAAIAWVGLAGGLLTAALGYWIDRHRTAKA
ncbi:MAG TPA: hypothetical protein VF211_04880 [Burkholderiales bacterium]